MDIFSAISDPTRRQIIERLNADGPLSIKALCEGMEMSRQGLTKHLDKMIKSKLVIAEFSGKERLHTLHPRAMDKLTSWLRPFSEHWDAPLDKLKTYLGEDNESPD